MITRLTNVKPLDELIYPTRREWSVEIYGDQKIVLKVAYQTIAYRASFEEVYTVLNLEFGGIDTLYLTKLCRIHSCNLDNIYISRAFRLQDTIAILQSLSQRKNVTIAILFPYNYITPDPPRYVEATKITSIINTLSYNNQVIIFNTITKFGYKMPDGGSLHHHLIKIIVKLTKRNRWIIAELIKHPAKPNSIRIFSEKTLSNSTPENEHRTLLRWIAKT